jgi:hypothetical protein
MTIRSVPSIAIFLICLVTKTYAQNIFDYEQKLELSEDYVRQEIPFTNPEDGVLLSGTLIYPKKEFNKVIIIVPGSGKDTRHSHHELAKEFLSKQIAVYRFDERGIGKSEGKYNGTATSLEKDVISAFRQLKNLKILSNKELGILGHSLGGIASAGALGKGCDFDFMIQMATPVENEGAFLKYQVSTDIDGFYTVKNKTPEEVIHFIDTVRIAVQPDIDYRTSKKTSKAIIKKLKFGRGRHIINPMIVDLMKQNHEETYKTSKTPILFIIGSQDRIVSSVDEIATLKRLNNPNITISLIEDVNHWLNDVIGPTKMNNSLYNMNTEALKTIVTWTLEK